MSGIGDSIWLAMKLINQPEAFHWLLPDGLPQRGKQVFDLLPTITASCTYTPDIGKMHAVKRAAYRGLWKNAPQRMTLEANSHLERGRRIEKYLPDLATSFVLPWEYETVPPISGKLIGLYGSSYSTARKWGGWDAKEWAELATMIGNGYTFVLFGAEWDLDMNRELIPMLEAAGLPYINTVGEPLAKVIGYMKQLQVFIGFPSGLSILNETLGAGDTVMAYPSHLHAMMNTWAHPERIASGAYKGYQFCPPKDIFEWMVKNNRL